MQLTTHVSLRVSPQQTNWRWLLCAYVQQQFTSLEGTIEMWWVHRNVCCLFFTIISICQIFKHHRIAKSLLFLLLSNAFP